jgi:hypothetical protein
MLRAKLLNQLSQSKFKRHKNHVGVEIGKSVGDTGVVFRPGFLMGKTGSPIKENTNPGLHPLKKI